MVDEFYQINRAIERINIHSIDMLAWHISKRFLNAVLPLYYKNKKRYNAKSARLYTDREVIISLTTFPARINTIPIVLETLFRQSVAADRVILWLAYDQFSDKSVISSLLSDYVRNGLEIKYCDDLRSHKKYFFSMQDNPESIIVTCDDDILYSEYMLERLLQVSQKHPGCIICERAHEITFDSEGVVRCYNQWNYRARGVQGPSLLLCPTGGAGCLYPPHSLSSHVFDIKPLKNLCFYADDIWLKCMSYLNGTEVVLTRMNNPEIIDTIGTNVNGLAKINVENNLNDKQFQDVTLFYSINWHDHS